MVTLTDQSLDSAKRGRPQSIPAWAWPTVFRLHAQGLGYRRVAMALLSLKVSTTKSSVERLIRGLPPYQGRHFYWSGAVFSHEKPSE